MNFKLFLTGAALASATLIASSAGAVNVILFDNLGAATTGSDSAATFGPLADSFSTGNQTITASGISVLVDGVSTDSGFFTVSVLNDAGTSPGSTFASGTFSDSFLNGTPTVLAFGCACTLAANTRYWIQLADAGASSLNWSWSTDISGVGVAGEYFANSGGVFPNDPNGPYQLQVSVTAVPEAATWAMMLTGFGLTGAALRRRNAVLAA